MPHIHPLPIPKIAPRIVSFSLSLSFAHSRTNANRNNFWNKCQNFFALSPIRFVSYLPCCDMISLLYEQIGWNNWPKISYTVTALVDCMILPNEYKRSGKKHTQKRTIQFEWVHTAMNKSKFEMILMSCNVNLQLHTWYFICPCELANELGIKTNEQREMNNLNTK